MRKLLKLILASLIIFSLKVNFSYGAKGPADIYKVTMEKIEFCLINSDKINLFFSVSFFESFMSL